MAKKSNKDAEAPKRSRGAKSVEGSTKKKKSRAEEVEEEEEAEVEDDVEMVCGYEEEEEESTGLSEARKAAIRRATNARAKQKGYRLQAARSGIGKSNMIQNVAGVQDVRRAARFRPVNLTTPPYALDEFKRRLELSVTPLPIGAAEALVPRFEKLLRTLVEDAVERMLPTGSQTLKASHLAPSVAAIDEFGDFSFLFPDGLRTFAQITDRKGKPTGQSNEAALILASATDVDKIRTDKPTQAKMKSLVKEAEAAVKKAKEARLLHRKQAKEARTGAVEDVVSTA